MKDEILAVDPWDGRLRIVRSREEKQLLPLHIIHDDVIPYSDFARDPVQAGRLFEFIRGAVGYSTDELKIAMPAPAGFGLIARDRMRQTAGEHGVDLERFQDIACSSAMAEVKRENINDTRETDLLVLRSTQTDSQVSVIVVGDGVYENVWTTGKLAGPAGSGELFLVAEKLNREFGPDKHGRNLFSRTNVIMLQGEMLQADGDLQKSLVSTCPQARILGTDDHSAVIGTLIQAQVLMGRVADTLLLDCLPQSQGLVAPDNQFIPILKTGMTIPDRKSRYLSTSAWRGKALELHVAERNDWDGTRVSRGLYRLEDFPRGDGARIKIEFDTDANGVFYLATVDAATGRRLELKQVAVN